MDSVLMFSNELALAVERAGRAVVAVNARARLGSTGVHWRPGLIVTADHTVHVDNDVTITSPDGRAVTATVAGRDPAIDVAILKVDAPDLAVAEVADSDAIRVGHIVMALGHGPRASWGVISAIGEGRGGRGAAGPVFHLDLTLYPGFSGGPLVDVQGRIVGMNTSGPGRHLHVAIPAAAVNRVVDDLLRRGRIPRAHLGVATQPVRLPEALRRDADQQTAVIVVDVQPESPAARAGLLIGDIIVSFGGTAITGPTDLRAVLRPDRVGQSLTASVLRGGQARDLPVIVGERVRRPDAR
jgi:S1-C subfamily serine protease